MGRTIFGRIRAAFSGSPHSENPFDELKMKVKKSEEDWMDILEDKFPIDDTQFLDIISEIESERDVKITIAGLENKLKVLEEKGHLVKKDTIFGYRYSISE